MRKQKGDVGILSVLLIVFVVGLWTENIKVCKKACEPMKNEVTMPKAEEPKK